MLGVTGSSEGMGGVKTFPLFMTGNRSPSCEVKGLSDVSKSAETVSPDAAGGAALSVVFSLASDSTCSDSSGIFIVFICSRFLAKLV